MEHVPVEIARTAQILLARFMKRLGLRPSEIRMIPIVIARQYLNKEQQFKMAPFVNWVGSDIF